MNLLKDSFSSNCEAILKLYNFTAYVIQEYGQNNFLYPNYLLLLSLAIYLYQKNNKVSYEAVYGAYAGYP